MSTECEHERTTEPIVSNVTKTGSGPVKDKGDNNSKYLQQKLYFFFKKRGRSLFFSISVNRD